MDLETPDAGHWNALEQRMNATIEDVRHAVPWLHWADYGTRYTATPKAGAVPDQPIAIAVRKDLRVYATLGRLGTCIDHAIDGDTLDDRLDALPATVQEVIAWLQDEAETWMKAAASLEPTPCGGQLQVRQMGGMTLKDGEGRYDVRCAACGDYTTPTRLPQNGRMGKCSAPAATPAHNPGLSPCRPT